MDAFGEEFLANMNDSRAGLLKGAVAAVPIALGYLPIAFSFGVAATRAGLSEAEAIMLSVVIYAGAAQFLALALVTSGASFVISAMTLIAMNLRHVLYGPALLKAAGEGRATASVWGWGFGLTDEVFGAALGHLVRGGAFSERFMWGLGAVAYASWVLGTALGAWAGGAALEGWPVLDAALGFMLPALFLALLLSILSRAQVPVIVVAGTVVVVVTLLASPTLGILAGMMAGAVTGVVRG